MGHPFIVLFLISILLTFTSAQTCSEFVESTTCGGNIVGNSGIIRYKLLKVIRYKHVDYNGDRTGCLWLIRSEINSKIEVRLLEDTLSSSQNIEINRLFMSGEIGGHSNWTIRSGDAAPRMVDGPIILIKFSSFEAINSSIPSRGFTLYYRGCGPDILNPPIFSHFYREKNPDDDVEVITYPIGGGQYKSSQMVTYLGLRKDRAILFNSEGDWKVKISFQDMEPSNACLFGDSLSFYSGGLYQLAAIDEQNDFIWRFCERNSTKTHIVPKRSPKYGNTFGDHVGILAVFSSDRSVEGTGFVFEW